MKAIICGIIATIFVFFALAAASSNTAPEGVHNIGLIAAQHNNVMICLAIALISAIVGAASGAGERVAEEVRTLRAAIEARLPLLAEEASPQIREIPDPPMLPRAAPIRSAPRQAAPPPPLR